MNKRKSKDKLRNMTTIDTAVRGVSPRVTPITPESCRTPTVIVITAIAGTSMVKATTPFRISPIVSL